MFYLTEARDMKKAIATLSLEKTLYLDIEGSSWTGDPRLSLIQVLIDPMYSKENEVYIFDVLESPDIVDLFIEKIMVNNQIEKVFHNAKFDLRYLGKDIAQNVTCTLEMARNIPHHILAVSDLSLKSLALMTGLFSDIDKTDQKSNWLQRPLTDSQMKYAEMDVIYLSAVHKKLLDAVHNAHQSSVDLESLTHRYLEVKEKWETLDAEKKFLEESIKEQMASQKMEMYSNGTFNFKLMFCETVTKETSFHSLAQLAIAANSDVDFPLRLTKDLQKLVGEDLLSQLPIEEKSRTSMRLYVKK